MALLPPPETSITSAIYAAYERAARKPDRWLYRLGASSIGNECLRELWYSWRSFSEDLPSGRMLRLFATGHGQELRIIQDLQDAGLSVWAGNEDGTQFAYTDVSGHFVCKLDGVIKGVPGAEDLAHTLEIKTHNRKSFDELCKKGMRASKPNHYAQMQAGMELSGIHHGLYVALCKDDESYYVERVAHDAPYAADLLKKVATLVAATLPPAGISTTQSAWGCKWCSSKAVCSGEDAPIATCRSCLHAEATNEGWVCGLLNSTLTTKQQVAMCDLYEVMI